MRKLLALLLILFLGVSLRAEQVILQTGEEIKCSNIDVRDGKVVIDKKREIPLEQVQLLNLYNVRESQTSVAPTVDKEVREIMDVAAKAMKKYPAAKGIMVKDYGILQKKKNGAVYNKYHFIGLVMSDETRSWGDVRLGFDESKSRSDLLLARCIQPDGTVINLDQSKMKIVLPKMEELSYFTANQEYKIKVGSIPGVKIGSIVEMVYETELFKPEDDKRMRAYWSFQSEIPVVDTRYEVIIPEDRYFNYMTENVPSGAAKPKTTREDGNIHYVWRMQNLPPLPEDEPNGYSRYEFAPQLRGCLQKDWSYLNEWQGKLLANNLVSTEKTKALAKKLTEGCKTDEEKLAKIYYFAQMEIRYVSIKGSTLSGVAGHPAEYTIGRKSGDCIDKAVVMAVLCKDVGIEAYPVSIRTNREDKFYTKSHMDEIPMPDTNHAITEVHLNGKIFNLDATATNYRYPYFRADDQGVPSWNAVKGTIRVIPPVPPEYNLRALTADAVLTPTGDFEVSDTVSFSGDMEAELRSVFKYLQKEQVQNWLHGIVNRDNPGSTIVKYNIENIEDIDKQLKLSKTYKMPGYATHTGDMMIFKMPFGFYFDETSLEKRRTPLVYSTSDARLHEIKIKLPAGYKMSFVPKPITLKSDYAVFTASFEVKDDTLIMRDKFERSKTVIPAKDYVKYRAQLQQIIDYVSQPLIITKDSK